MGAVLHPVRQVAHQEVHRAVLEVRAGPAGVVVDHVEDAVGGAVLRAAVGDGDAVGRALTLDKQFDQALSRFEAVLSAEQNTPEANRQKLLASVGKAACLARSAEACTTGRREAALARTARAALPFAARGCGPTYGEVTATALAASGCKPGIARLDHGAAVVILIPGPYRGLRLAG